MNGAHVAKCLRSLASMLSGRESVEQPELVELVGLAVYGMPTLAMKRAEAGRMGGKQKASNRVAKPPLLGACQAFATDGGVGGGLSGDQNGSEKEADLGFNLTGQISEPADASKAVASGTLLAIADHDNRSDIMRVFEFWKANTDHGRAVLDRKRSSRIAARMRDGFTPERLMVAIANRRNDPFLMGANDTGRVYDGIETLLRDAAQVERLEVLTSPVTRPVTPRSPPQTPASMLAERARRMAAGEKQ